ncbi:MAG TPA: dihydrolipoamide acetyltransferase family protein [Candidatus Megaira endosymbiont of Hartmannula sinica]|nr:dihydrolipoamide acetyltransferase family protein [Candidatus Megaera endosymbiont of Hartmannula sinica]
MEKFVGEILDSFSDAQIIDKNEEKIFKENSSKPATDDENNIFSPSQKKQEDKIDNVINYKNDNNSTDVKKEDTSVLENSNNSNTKASQKPELNKYNISRDNKYQSNLVSDQKNNSTNNFSNHNINNNTGRIFASPLAKKIARENNIDITNIRKGSGPYNRIVKHDVERYVGSSGNQNSQQNSQNIYDIDHNGNLLLNNIVREKEYEEVKVSKIQKIVADRLTYAKQEIPHFYLNISCGVSSLIETRSIINKRNNNPLEKISINDFIIKAVAMAMQDNPVINSSFISDSSNIRKYNNIDIGFAVSVDGGGIITPIVRNANHRAIKEISVITKDLIKRSRNKTITEKEYTGGGITISNLGMYGIESFSAIVNPPQSSILSIGSLCKMPSTLPQPSLTKHPPHYLNHHSQSTLHTTSTITHPSSSTLPQPSLTHPKTTR